MITLDGLAISNDLIWEDEFQWSNVQASKKYTLGGKLIVETGEIASSKGRPITLTGNNAVVTRSVLDTLFSWAQEAGKVMTLVMNDGRSFNVCFRHWESPVLEPAYGEAQYIKPKDTDIFLLTMRLAVI